MFRVSAFRNCRAYVFRRNTHMVLSSPLSGEILLSRRQRVLELEDAMLEEKARVLRLSRSEDVLQRQVMNLKKQQRLQPPTSTHDQQ